MVEWLLAYLLVGFVLSWIGTNVFSVTPDNTWPWELAAVLLWPFTIVLVLISRLRTTDHG